MRVAGTPPPSARPPPADAVTAGPPPADDMAAGQPLVDAVAAAPPPADDLAAWLSRADPVNAADPASGASAARRARDLAQAQQQPIEVARASGWLCSHLLRQGLMAEARLEARRALPLMTAPELVAVRCETLRLVALAGAEAGAFDEALEAANALVQEGARLGSADVALTAAFSLAACFERMGDSWQSLRVLQEAVARHGEKAPPRVRLMALNGLVAIAIGTFHRLRDAVPGAERQEVLEQARRAGEAARVLLGPHTEPASVAAVLGNLGEVLLHQGASAQAEALLAEALHVAGQRGLVAHAWRVRASLGDLLMAQGRAGDAAAAMRTLLAEMGDAAPPATELRARDCAYRAARALGDVDAALQHLELFERLERRRTVTQLRAQSEWFVTRSEVQQAQWQAEQARQDARNERERAERDPLTGLGNRRHFERRVAEMLAAAERAGTPLSLVMVDLDHFKAINDKHGHSAGDGVLCGLARLMGEHSRGDDLLARLGGEEFVIVMAGMTLAQASERSEHLRTRLAATAWPELPAGVAVTASFGVSAAPPYDRSTLLTRADAALYEAKRSGRNRVSEAHA